MDNNTNGKTKKNGLTYEILLRTKPEYATELKTLAEEKFTSVNSLINIILDKEIKKIQKRKEIIR